MEAKRRGRNVGMPRLELSFRLLLLSGLDPDEPFGTPLDAWTQSRGRTFSGARGSLASGPGKQALSHLEDEHQLVDAYLRAVETSLPWALSEDGVPFFKPGVLLVAGRDLRAKDASYDLYWETDESDPDDERAYTKVSKAAAAAALRGQAGFVRRQVGKSFAYAHNPHDETVLPDNPARGHWSQPQLELIVLAVHREAALRGRGAKICTEFTRAAAAHLPASLRAMRTDRAIGGKMRDLLVAAGKTRAEAGGQGGQTAPAGRCLKAAMAALVAGRPGLIPA